MELRFHSFFAFFSIIFDKRAYNEAYAQTEIVPAEKQC